ncbi:MAG: ABC transporter substrate-binding protein [Fibrobacterota bacterium]
MTRLFPVFFAAFLLTHGMSEARDIVDMAGRKVHLPDTIRTVYPTSPMGDIILYTLAPDMAAGTSWNLCKEERAYLNDVYNKKPVLGGWYGKNTTGNPEVILKAHPDIILSIGYMDQSDAAFADRIQQQIGIPVVIADARLLKMDTAYRFLGSIIGIAARADSLAVYCRRTLDEVTAAVSKIPMGKRIRTYYAEGLKGLETDPSGSMHAEVLDFVGSVNVADIPMAQLYGRATVTFEQILFWKPELILVCLDMGYAGGDGIYQRIMKDPDWQNIPAVRRGRIYQIPTLPFNWIDRPPCVNRVIGIKWLANLLYPDYYRINIRDEIQRFYSLFYHKRLTDAELKQVLQNALPR